MTITVIIADDHAWLRGELESLLAFEPDLSVVGQAADGNEALRLVYALEPDILLADIAMPGLGAIEIARQLQSVNVSTAVVVLTPHQDEGSAYEALEAGAKGYLTKISAGDDLARAIRAVARGETFIAANCYEDCDDGLPCSAAELAELTPIELDLLSLIAQGRTSREMMAALNVSAPALTDMRTALAKRLGVVSRVQLSRLAAEYGLV